MSRNSILDLVFCPWSMYALFGASRLEVFTLLAAGGATAEQLAERTGARLRVFTALLDACVAMGLLRRKGNLYLNSHLSDAYLVEGRPLYVGDFIELQSVESASWQRLYDVITGNGEARIERTEAEVNQHRFTMAMNNLGMLGEADALANAVDLSGCRKMADVGGGSGLYSVVLCRHHPDLRATVLDVEEVLETTRQIIEDNGLQDRIETRKSDITEDSYGENLDVVLLSDVLYQDRRTCTTILQSAYRALAEGGKLVVRGYFADPEGPLPLFGALFALKLQLDDPNREIISVPLLCEWIEQAGFRNVRAFALTERSSCLMALR